MSEFKFACPVCGQHMNCDSSQAGSVVECPTCFQKITAPQTTATGDQKFILTGTKFAAKRPAGIPDGSAGPHAPGRQTWPVGIVILIVVVLAAGAGVLLWRQPRPVEILRRVVPVAPILSSAWQAADIGNVGVAGALNQAEGVATLSGSGADIWQRADGFHFVFQALNGDGALSARVLDIKYTDEWAKGGVMIRESTNAGSVFALASLRADGQAQMIWRSATGIAAQASELVGGTGYPKFVKIVRNGGRFSAYFKANADDAWSQMGSTQSINMSTNSLVGLFVCSHNNVTICEAQFDEVALQNDLPPAGK